jgi:hypothetical protein
MKNQIDKQTTQIPGNEKITPKKDSFFKRLIKKFFYLIFFFGWSILLLNLSLWYFKSHTRLLEIEMHEIKNMDFLVHFLVFFGVFLLSWIGANFIVHGRAFGPKKRRIQEIKG